MNVYALMSLAALGVNLTVGLYVLSRGPRMLLNRLFFAVVTALAVWSLGELITRASLTVEAATWGAMVGSLGWCAVGGLFVLFVLAFTERVRWLARPLILAALFLPGLVLVCLTWTTDLLFKGFEVSYWGYQEIHGTLRPVSTAYVAAPFVAGLFLVNRFRATTPSKRKRTWAFYVMVAAAIPLLAGLVTDVILPLAGVRVVQMTVFASTLVGPIIGYAVVSRNLMSTVAGSLGATILTHIDDAVIIADARGTVEEVNPAASRLTGYPEAELVGSPVDRLFIEGARRVHSGGTTGGEERLDWSLCATRTGEVVPVTRGVCEVRRRRGRLVGTVTVLHDMEEAFRLLEVEREIKVASERVSRERERSERIEHRREEFRKLTRFLESVIENIAEPLFIQDASGRYVFANEAFRNLAGYSSTEIVGRADHELYWHEHAGAFSESVRRVFETGESAEFPEMSLINREGVPHVTRTFASPMKTESGEVEFVVGITRDITEQLRLEGARLDFIRIAAHELRTPLTSLKLGFELLARETRGTLNPEQQRSLDILSLSIERLNRLSRNLLDLASMDAGLVALDVRPLDVESLFHEARAVFSSAVADKGLELRVEAPEGTGRASGDAARLSQVLCNLVSNAVKYTDSGTITMSARRRVEKEIEISVSDTGQGIPAEAREAIFTRFSKARSAQTAREGTGLGLSISKAIVEAHGGRIWVESAPGRGSTFTFTVPVEGGGRPCPAGRGEW